MSSDQTTSLLGLASTYAVLGRRDDASATLTQAADLLSKKGVLPGVAHVERLIAEL